MKNLNFLVVGVAIASATLVSIAGPVRAEDAAPAVTWGAFVDSYYAWDANRPTRFDRAYTTQAARHAEFNVNLAFVEARLAGPRTRGRLAVQWGTSVQSNYAGEPRNGALSGPEVSQFVQEAVAGYRLAPSLWIDGGIFLSHIGYESWISRDNLAYTRSLVAEYSPYYESGAKLTWMASPAVTAQLAVVNGWQNISSENESPAAGIRVDWTLPRGLTLSYDNLLAEVAPDSSESRMRFYNDVIAQFDPSPRWRFAAAVGFGTQSESAPDGGSATWGGAVGYARWQATPRAGVVARVETYQDVDQVVLASASGAGFRTVGASIGLDVAPAPNLRWRSELRWFDSPSPVWPAHETGMFEKQAGFFVTSLSVTL